MLKHLNRRQLVAGLGLGLCFPGVARAAASRPVVVELFTSQGCSSCPPADAIFSDLTLHEQVVALTYHVDYWDYLGWRDTLGSKEFSQRQYDYAKSRGDMEVYTPQAIINGRSHVVGSKKADIVASIEAAAKSGGTWVDFGLEGHAKNLTVTLPETPGVQDATLWLIAVEKTVDVKIERGENAGRTVSYKNVVRKMSPAAMWNGEVTTIRMPRNPTMPEGANSCAALLQLGKAGPVIGVSRMADLS